MTNKTDFLRQIEERLGNEGSPELAEQMFDALQALGAVDFDATVGFVFVGEDHESGDFPAWDKALGTL